jgi:hypothetical protein
VVGAVINAAKLDGRTEANLVIPWRDLIGPDPVKYERVRTHEERKEYFELCVAMQVGMVVMWWWW